MKLTTDFECGNGRLTPPAPVDERANNGNEIGNEQVWRMEAVGDLYGYNRYFCVQIDNRGQPAAKLRLSVFADSRLTNSHFMSHFPSELWYCANDDWRRWVPLRHTWEDSTTFHDDHIEVRLNVPANALLVVATNPPWRHRDYVTWLDTLRQRGVEIETIGQSFAGRDIHALRLGTRSTEGAAQSSGKPRLLVLSGMHASEHGGVWASRGIVEYLLSSIRSARSIEPAFDIAVVPMLNPDGNVAGCAGGSTQRLEINNSLDFQNTSQGALPRYQENQVLWQWLSARFAPDVLLHFHGYLGRRRFGDEPCDGLYGHENIDAVYASDGRRRAYRAMLDRLRFQTAAFTGHWFMYGGNAPGQLEIELAEKFQTLGVLYEVNCGTTGIALQMQRGPQVLEALAGALIRDVRPREWSR
jgi:hypothetical protein